MNIDKIENLTLGELRDIYSKVSEKSISEALPIMREFRDSYEMTDKDALNAFSVADRIFSE